jgi:hypothetical protein
MLHLQQECQIILSLFSMIQEMLPDSSLRAYLTEDNVGSTTMCSVLWLPYYVHLLAVIESNNLAKWFRIMDQNILHYSQPYVRFKCTCRGRNISFFQKMHKEDNKITLETQMTNLQESLKTWKMFLQSLFEVNAENQCQHNDGRSTS